MTKMNIALTLLSAIAYLARGADSARDPDMSLVNLPESTSPGGRCMDGTMAGYLIREGTNPSLFVIDLKGGGACTTQEECDARVNSVRGTSRDWNVDMVGLGFLSQDCDGNPDFCEATAVHVMYCTSDGHRGTNDQPSELSWGYYFDGHLNFVAIIEKLIAEKGLGDATNVLLTGGSAGAVGALFNVDWLAGRLSNATVKTAPSAGWYSPNALDDDLPVPHQPSDFDHFSRGEYGNPFYNLIQAGGAPVDVWKAKNSMSPDCLAAYSDDEWWSCFSARWAYKYIKSPIYMIHTQYDSNQIFSGNQAPHAPVNDTELDAVKRYIQMWGNATRESLEETIVIDDVAFPKAHSDGIFSASCITHGTPGNVAIDGYYVNPLVHDWFFQNGKYDADKYKLIESCEPLEGNEEYVIPCNSATACAYKGNGGGEKEVVMRCAKRLDMEGCLQSFGPKIDCFSCAKDNTDALVEAGCTSKIVELVCKYAEENDIFDEFEGREVDVDFDELENPDDDCIFKSECEDSSDGIGSSSGAVFRYAPAYGSVLMLGMITFLVVSSPFINLCNIIIL